MPTTPDNTAYLFAAFTVVWLLIFGYMLYLGSRVSGLRDEVAALQSDLERRAPEGATPDTTRESFSATPE